MHGTLSRRAVAVPAPAPAPPLIRLRVVLLLLLLGGTFAFFWPRGRAAWQLHNRATALADYAMCMVGPTGPELIREARAGYSALLRLRVITAAGEAQPFSRCTRFSERLGHSEARLAAHRLTAAEFSEFWGEGEGAPGTRSVVELDTSLAELGELGEAAWPFVREGYARLVQPSSHTEEAVHATPPAEPGVGSGLWDRRYVYRSAAVFGNHVVAALGSGAHLVELISDDGGVHFRSGTHGQSGELTERCAVDLEGRSFTVTVTESGERVVLSHGPGAAPQVAQVGRKEDKLLGVVCDAVGLVAMLERSGGGSEEHEVAFRFCAFRGGCQELAVPTLGGRSLRYPLDVARIDGDTIIAVAVGGLTRVTSSRDQGRTWSPWTVAFDRASLTTDIGAKTPFRLLRVGPSVLLYGGGRRADEAYYLLVTSDHGATFREPD